MPVLALAPAAGAAGPLGRLTEDVTGCVQSFAILGCADGRLLSGATGPSASPDVAASRTGKLTLRAPR